MSSNSCAWITGVETSKTADDGHVRLYGYSPKSVTAGLSRVLG